jgi:hypothetical protein
MFKNWRFWTGIGVGILVTLLAVTTLGVVLAQGPEPDMPSGQGAGFVDEDGDGVCDRLGTGEGMGRGRGFVDEDGDSVCENFVDEDGDGVCDRLSTGEWVGRGRRAAGGWMSGHQGGCWQ